MAWRNKPPLSLEQRLRKIAYAGLLEKEKRASNSDEQALESIDSRIRLILDLVEKSHKNKNHMLFFVMYDIESNKVRNQVVNYLIRSGCHRIQKSIFLGNLPHEKYKKIREDLVEVQSYYENHDSIILVPISTDELSAMKIIGQSIDIDIISKKKNTLFF
jgi:CRISPR-associated protein Cas2